VQPPAAAPAPVRLPKGADAVVAPAAKTPVTASSAKGKKGH
jgi:hypothetical protein